MADWNAADAERALLNELADIARGQARPGGYTSSGPSAVVGLGCDLASTQPFVWAIVRLVDGGLVGIYKRLEPEKPHSDVVSDLSIALLETRDQLNADVLATLSPSIQKRTDERGVTWLVPGGVAPWDRG